VGFETAHLFREVEILADTDGPMTFIISTEVPGRDVIQRYRFTFDTPTTEKRLPVKIRVPGNVRGKLHQLRIEGQHVCRLYGVRVYAKPLGIKSAWRWYVIPVVPTPEDWSRAALPIVPTPEGWEAARLPIVPTAEGFEAMPLPLKETPLEPFWVDIPVDVIE